MNDILYAIALVLLYLGTVWTYERRTLALEDTIHFLTKAPGEDFDTAARQAIALNTAKLTELLEPYVDKVPTTDTIVDDYTCPEGSTDRMLVLLDSLHENEQPKVEAFSQDEIDRYN